MYYLNRGLTVVYQTVLKIKTGVTNHSFRFFVAMLAHIGAICLCISAMSLLSGIMLVGQR